MESAEAPVVAGIVRRVPEDRIKTLNFQLTIDARTGSVSEEYMQMMIMQSISEQFAKQLIHYHKVKRVDNGDGTFTFTTALDIIVPPTP